MSTEFETVSVLPRSASYMDSIEGPNSFLMEPTMDYLSAHYDANPPSPSFGGGMNSTSMDFSDLSLSSGLMSYTYGSSFAASPRSYSPAADSASISPPTLTYNLSSGEMSSDESHIVPQRRTRGEDSTPPPGSYTAAVPRAHRYNPISIPATRASARAAHKRRGSKSSNEHESDAEEEEEYQPGNGVDPRREAVRRQRIESEQRRRDELRDGYSRLKAVLPPSSAKSSKVSLLDRAAMHLKHLETVNKQAEIRLKAAEAELVRVRSLNEVLSLRAVQQREAAMAGGVGQAPNF